MGQKTFKYFAFISYNSKDTEWGKRVQRKLEHYRMPSTLCSEHGWERTPIKPVFFAPTDIQPGGLTEELKERLRASRNLIVICSPNSARSEWVGKEIEFFHQIGRTKQIHFFIVEGAPHSGNAETECFNPIVEKLGLPEMLGANIHEKIYRWPWLNKERAYVQLISKLLGVEFDAIWQRHKRLLIQKGIMWTIGVMAVIAALVGVWIGNQPVDVSMRLNETTVHNEKLPALKDAVVTLTLDNETKSDTIRSIDGEAVFTNIPHRFLEKEVRINVKCKNHLNIDTTLLLTRHLTLNIQRDTTIYGHIRVRLWSSTREIFLPRQQLTIAGREVTSDDDAVIELFIPLEEQRTAYPVTAAFPLANDTLYMPCGEDAVIDCP